MTKTGELADFALSVLYDDLSGNVREVLKKRVLDSVGIAIGPLDTPAMGHVRETMTDLEPTGPCQLWGTDRLIRTTVARSC